MSQIKRKSISKKTREAVWNKYGHHCAYCGCELEYKDMVVDHFIPVFQEHFKKYSAEEIESESNYIPSCRMCNYYKRARGIESMRKDIEHLYKQLDRSFDYRLAKKYGLLNETPHKVKFYFEVFEEERDDV